LIVLLYNSDVVLNQLSQEVLQVIARMFSQVCSEWLELAELLFNFLIVEGHKFIGQELSHIFSNQLVLVKFSSI